MACMILTRMTFPNGMTLDHVEVDSHGETTTKFVARCTVANCHEVAILPNDRVVADRFVYRHRHYIPRIRRDVV